MDRAISDESLRNIEMGKFITVRRVSDIQTAFPEAEKPVGRILEGGELTNHFCESEEFLRRIGCSSSVHDITQKVKLLT